MAKSAKKADTKEWRAGDPVSALAFMRSVEPTLGRMYGAAEKDASGENLRPILVITEGFLGQISPSSRKEKGEDNLGLNLPGYRQNARTDGKSPWLNIMFSVRFMSLSKRPSMTDVPAVSEVFENICAAAHKRGVYRKVAARYVWSMLNARFAWRNRVLASSQWVTVTFGERSLSCDPLRLELSEPLEEAHAIAAALGVEANSVSALIDEVEDALTRDDRPLVVDVRWQGNVGRDATVYPSQAYPTGNQKSYAARRAGIKSAELGKVLVSVPHYVGKSDGESQYEQHAVLTDQKIGAALRCFDDWHGENVGGPNGVGKPVPVNPYAGDKETSTVFRKGAKKDSRNVSLYDLLLSDSFMSAPENANEAHLAFVIASLIRGGVYQTKEAENPDGEKEEADA